MKDLNVKCLSKVDSRKRDLNATKSSSKEDASSCYVKLMKDDKIICRTKCTNPPIQPSSFWNVDIVKKTRVKGLYDLPQFLLFPAFEDPRQKSEWIKFLTFLCMNNRVATVVSDSLKIHVYPPECTNSSETDEGLYFAHAVVAYELQEVCDTSVDQRHATSAAVRLENGGKELPQLHSVPQTPCINDAPAFDSVTCAKRSSSAEKGTCSSISKCHEAVNSLHPFCAKDDVAAERNFVRADPSYLKTLGQAHSGWVFGAIAELVDNSRDASASRLAIAIETIYAKTVGAEIPMLSITDDGIGMNHEEILRMISFGHKQPDEDNLDRIGRFGVGFKTGSMKLGRDALVLTQTSHSRSIAFLSQSLNEGKDNLEIPVVSYRRQAQCMEIDTSAQSEALARYNLNAIKEFSPFDEYLIGEKAGLFEGKTGTQIYIWNLDKWGSDYTLEWQEGMRGGSSFHQGDILIRSRRVRSRPGQISRKVHLDYSLRSYLEVIFLEPRMKIFVQGSLLTLGRSQVEWDEANCGIFLYWHGRLIEAYKRVGGMIHSADMGRGVIGVIDVTEVMDDWVHNNKQGFQDCEPYACLEQWLGKKADEYWDANFDAVQLKKRNARYKPDNELVQCDKCRKWRTLPDGFDSKRLPKDWFCYMEPFSGRCEAPEEETGRDVITVGLKRSYDDPSTADRNGGFLIDDDSPAVEVVLFVNARLPGNGQDESTKLAADDVERPVLKRLRRGPPRTPKKQPNRS
ncbi:MORC family CW-type zinc finger protein 3 [Bienertia sinuspersici]